MITDEFAANDWIERLAQALAALAEAQEPYRDELAPRHQQSLLDEMEKLLGKPLDYPPYELFGFYSRAHSQGGYFAEHYAPVRAALAEARAALAAHPVLAHVLDSLAGKEAFCIQIANRGKVGTLLGMISGLMARGMGVPEGGFRLAASEFNALLDPAADPDRTLSFEDLSVGYHVMFFHGLQVTERHALTEDMAVLPFEQLNQFVSKSVLQDVAPGIIRFNRHQSVGAIVKPFRWKPEFRAWAGNFEPDLDWGDSFFEYVGGFVEFLTVFHAAPVICLATISFCIQRAASFLLGQPHDQGTYKLGRSTRSFDRFAGENVLNGEKFEECKKAFDDQGSGRYEAYAPVIARLAEALARDGRFAVDDRILDVAIVLERMYKLDGGEISHKMRIRAAWFLGADAESRVREMKAVKEFYKARSAIVHSRETRAAAEKQRAAFEKGFDIARRSLFRLLRDEPPNDWDELVVSGN